MNTSCTYSNKFKRTHFINDIKKDFYKKDIYYFNRKEFSICGRVYRRRIMGQSIFLEIKDNTDKIQIYLSKDKLLNYKDMINDINIGDIIGIKGLLFKTKTEELSLNVKHIDILAKNLKNFPDKRFGLLDKEICYRERYLDLIANDTSKEIFIFRSKLISTIRNFFQKKNYIEVETPIIQNIAGGADAEPFKTFHKHLNTELYLRISPELYLKKLIVGGLDKVFEIGKNFRNESVSPKHHPEFTMIEFYEAYATYEDLMILTENLLKYLTKTFFNKEYIIYNDKKIDFSNKFEKINFFDAIKKYCDEISDYKMNDKNYLTTLLKKNNIHIENLSSLEDFQCKVFDTFVEKNLINPTFILHHPLNISPLSKKHEIKQDVAERFELYICGKEIANGFSELNDPIDQKQRFINQIQNKKDSTIDNDYINALNYGMPPTAGEGIGLDRLIMLLTNSHNIKDIILFPFMREK